MIIYLKKIVDHNDNYHKHAHVYNSTNKFAHTTQACSIPHARPNSPVGVQF